MRKGVVTEENKDKNPLNESDLSEIDLSMLSNLQESQELIENMNKNVNINLNNYANDNYIILKDEYSCTQCELPPEILYDTEESQTIKIKCEKHGTKTLLISDYLQLMSKNTYHYYKCGLCKKNNQKNFNGQIFKYCYHCKRILCPKCFMKHKSYKEHKKIFPTSEINIRCEKHLGEKYEMYCYDCDKSICKKCSEGEHKTHFIISLKELNPSGDMLEKINFTINELKQEINNLFKTIEFIKSIISLNELILSAYEKNENNYHHIINVSNLYKSIMNPNQNENIISSVLDIKNYVTQSPVEEKKELLISKFDLKIENHFQNLNKVNSNEIEKKYSLKTITYKPKPKTNKYDARTSIMKEKWLKKNKNIVKFNKKYNINLTIESNEVLLNHLNIDDNDFKQLCEFNLPKLSKLFLSENNISNLSPLTLMKAQQLEELYLNNNNIESLDAIANINITQLKSLILYCNKISSIDILSDLTFTNLIQLNLYNNKVSNIEVLSRIHMPKLQILHLGFNKISNIDILAKVKFPELTSLNLNRNEISSIKVLEKTNFSKLEKLDFFDNSISDISVLSKTHFPSLKELNFWINNIQNIEPFCKADFPNLQKLNLSNNNISDLSCATNFIFPSLNELNIQYNKIDVEDENIKNLLNEIRKKIAIIKY